MGLKKNFNYTGNSFFGCTRELMEFNTYFIFTVFSIYKVVRCLLISKQPSARVMGRL